MDVHFSCNLRPSMDVIIQGHSGLVVLTRPLAPILPNSGEVLGVFEKLARRVHISHLIHYVDQPNQKEYVVEQG